MKGDWQADKAVAKAILSDPGLRRKVMRISLIIDLSLFAIGLWLIDGWLEQAALRFLLWWAACGLVTVWLILFAAYDALMVIQETKNQR